MASIVTKEGQRIKGVKVSLILDPEQYKELIEKLHVKLGRPITAGLVKEILYQYVADVPTITQTTLQDNIAKPITELPTTEIVTEEATNTEQKPVKTVHTTPESDTQDTSELLNEVDAILNQTIGLEQNDNEETFIIDDDDF